MTIHTLIPHPRGIAWTAQRILSLVACTLVAGTAAAQSGTTAAGNTAVDPSAYTHQITVMANTCANCHGTDGAYAGAIPAIAGRPADVLEAQLLHFKTSPTGPTNTVMGRIAKGFTDAELRQLADYYAAKR